MYEILGLLFYRQNEDWWTGFPKRKERMNGNRLHEFYGFDQPEVFTHPFLSAVDGQVWLIAGQPDLINIEELTIEELKTYKYTSNYARQLKVGKEQANINCAITGLRKWKVHLLNAEKRKFTAPVKGWYDPVRASRAINSAIAMTLFPSSGTEFAASSLATA